MLRNDSPIEPKHLESLSGRDGAFGKLLFIGADVKDFEALRDTLATDEAHPKIILDWSADLVSALASLQEKTFQAILLDLSLPDSEGLLTLEAVQASARRAPILVISSPGDEATARSAVKWGARDYAIKGRLEFHPFARRLRSLIERRWVDDALYAEKERAEVTLNSIGDAVLSTDLSGRVTYLNAVAERLTGWSREEAAGRLAAEVFKIVDGKTGEPVDDPLGIAVPRDMPTTLKADSVLVRRDGFESAIADSIAPIHDRGGAVSGSVVVFRDVGDTRAANEKLAHQAQHDFLTDLPNRVLFADRLDQAIAMARRHQRRLAVLFLDCDRFKEVNDTLGHDTGDLLLQSVAMRLVAVVRMSDTVSRQGGDEFVILLSEMENAEDATICARKIMAALSRPHRLGQYVVNTTASLGIAIYPASGRNAETLIKAADGALYEAKKRGGNGYYTFSSEMRQRASERESAEAGLARALELGEFCLHYQPRVDLASGAVAGLEALIRWNHPERGLTGPAEFVPMAEDCGLIVPIGRWVLKEACRQFSEWSTAGLRDVALSVNVSPIELRSADFLEHIEANVRTFKVGARALELELTESVLMDESETTGTSLRALNKLGVRLALDDFGTGYSSLSYLTRFPISTLKIDRSFVQNLATDANARTVVGAIIGMGKSLGQAVIAEGVETEAQFKVLRDLRCDGGQGYYFSRPLPAHDVAALYGAHPGQAMPHQGKSLGDRAALAGSGGT